MNDGASESMRMSPVRDAEGELRWNPLTLKWVVVAPGRSLRPLDSESIGDDATDPNRPCPLCPGSESELPSILWELPAGAVPTNPSDWSVRAVPNRFPAFRDGAAAPTHPMARPAEGFQEVLIENPSHQADLSTMHGDELDAVVEGYVARYSAIAGRPGISRVLLFRNRGARAGTSLRHPHTQLVGLAWNPPDMRARDRAFRALREEASGACPICAHGTIDREWSERVVHRNDGFVAWVPRAAESPFEVWIAPLRHAPDPRDLSHEERHALARMVGWVTRRYVEVAGDPAYNLLLHSAAINDPLRQDLHWWIRLRPRVGHPAGLELLTGVMVNPSSPEEDAQQLSELPTSEAPPP